MGMDLKEAYGEGSRRLDRLDFGMLLPGLHRYPFALHTEAEVCLGDRNFPNEGRFLANTAMEFEGRRMAVWRLSATQQNYDTLAASLVHEMCHAFQVETKTQFPDLIFGAFYPRNLSNYTAKYVENLLLAGLLYDFDPVKWDDLLSLRARRLMSMPEAVRYEQLTEGIEGQAKYVELKALAKLSPGQHSSALSGLAASLKDRAENLMIVDLMRNDLARVCMPGSVKASTITRRGGCPTTTTFLSGRAKKVKK